MERNNWNNRQGYTNDRNRSRENERRVDEDTYRGAYRLDTSSDHRNETTWDGFDRRDERNRRGTDYNHDFNRNYNNDYNRNYNSDQGPYRGESERGDGFSRDSRSQYRSGNTQNLDQPTSGGYGTRFGGHARDNQNRDRYGAGNFNVDYSPDNYGSRTKGLNEGNMAGSLSFGYDGDNNADPDWNRRYDPLSGHRHSYHGNYESRHPERGQYRDNRNHRDSDNNWF